MYNEEQIASESIKMVMDYAAQIPFEFKLVAVDDGSKDRTSTLLEKARIKYPDHLVPLTHKSNMGYGAALRTGIDYAIRNDFDYILFMDSDLTNHPKYIKDFYTRMLEGFDYIKASRYLARGGMSGVPRHRRLISRLGNKFAKVLFGLPLHDLTNGFRAVKADILKRITLKESGFAVIMEELFLCKPFVATYAEVPYILTSRGQGQGKTHFTYDVKTYLGYFKYALKSIKIQSPPFRLGK